KVGQVAAEMRSLRPPDPYKNKGVRYAGERLKKKVGKTGAKYPVAGRWSLVVSRPAATQDLGINRRQSWANGQRLTTKDRFHADTNYEEREARACTRPHSEEDAGNCGASAAQRVPFAESHLRAGDR